MSFVFRSKLPMTRKYANRSLFLFVCGSSLNLAIATTTFPTTTMFFCPCLFSTHIVAWVCPHDRELRLPCFQFPVCGNHVEWRSSPSLSPLRCGMGVPMIKNCDCPVINFPFVGTMLNGAVLISPYPSVIVFLI